MAYDKTIWVNGQIALSAENMNHIEQGVSAAHEDITTINAAIQTEALKEQLLDVIYPVGSIYMSATLDTAAKVTAALGGTWEAWGAGKVPVGVNSSETEFSTVEKTGGAKTVTLTTAQTPGHTHTYNKANTPTGSATVSASGTATAMNGTNRTQLLTFANKVTNCLDTLKAKTGASISVPSLSQGNGSTVVTGISGGAHTHTVGSTSTASGSTGGGGAHNNLQPYITCYMYKRTA